jgi:hypothetical protein
VKKKMLRFSFDSPSYYHDDKLKEDEMDAACSAHVGEKFVQNFDWKTSREETIQKT